MCFQRLKIYYELYVSEISDTRKKKLFYLNSLKHEEETGIRFVFPFFQNLKTYYEVYVSEKGDSIKITFFLCKKDKT